jgi:hypothetical protein
MAKVTLCAGPDGFKRARLEDARGRPVAMAETGLEPGTWTVVDLRTGSLSVGVMTDEQARRWFTLRTDAELRPRDARRELQAAGDLDAGNGRDCDP